MLDLIRSINNDNLLDFADSLEQESGCLFWKVIGKVIKKLLEWRDLLDRIWFLKGIGLCSSLHIEVNG